MMRAVLAVALAVVVAAGTGACAHRSASGVGTQSGSSAPPRTGDKTTPQPVDDAKGYVEGAISGDNRISCDKVDAEVKVVAKEGKARWTASAKRSPTFADKLLAEGITVSPASGVLESGQSTVLHVRGSFDKRNQFFSVFLVSRSGGSAKGVEFKCR
jgi:hypothetical protein